jgi:glycosyltransferase involved in cell wall biosynthesis
LPGFKDIKIFRFWGKKTMVIFTGCDIRLPGKVEKYKWNPCRECTDIYKNFVGCVLETKPDKIKNIEDKFDIIISADEAAGSLSREYTPTLFPVDIERFKYTGTNPGKKLRILHAPSHPEYKGTKYVIQAIEKLKTEFDFDFSIIRDVKAEVLYKEIEKADLIIDQMLVGFYGLFSIESMAMGKPVICYIRQDIADYLPADTPVINADPDTLFEVLKDILKAPEKLNNIGKISREYVEKYHDAKVIAKQYYELLDGGGNN